jgi:hypothetical protein
LQPIIRSYLSGDTPTEDPRESLLGDLLGK